MTVQRGKKPKYLIRAERGLLNGHIWQRALQSYPTDLVCSIRQQLVERVPGLTEKFNRRCRYFGYWVGACEDKVYIYVQKKNLRIDLDIDRKFEQELRKAGYEVRYSNNYQGRAGWITGWYVPQSTTDVKTVLKWLSKAFEQE